MLPMIFDTDVTAVLGRYSEAEGETWRAGFIYPFNTSNTQKGGGIAAAVWYHFSICPFVISGGLETDLLFGEI